MQTSLNLVLNLFLLLGIFLSAHYLIKFRKKNMLINKFGHLKVAEEGNLTVYRDDEILSVRKIQTDERPSPSLGFPEIENKTTKNISENINPKTVAQQEPKTVLLLLSATENNVFRAQTTLNILQHLGLTLGKDRLFHSYLDKYAKRALLFSVATATDSGKFDFQYTEKGAVKGLCLFTNILPGEETALTIKRLSALYHTGQYLAKTLDAILLDERRKPLSDDNLDVFIQSSLDMYKIDTPYKMDYLESSRL